MPKCGRGGIYAPPRGIGLTTNERGKLVKLDKWEEVEDELESAEIF